MKFKEFMQSIFEVIKNNTYDYFKDGIQAGEQELKRRRAAEKLSGERVKKECRRYRESGQWKRH